MKIRPISTFGYQLTRLRFVNAYLIREPGASGEPDGFTLIDTMIGGSADAILAAAASLDAPIRRILLTHAHADHIGSVDALAARLPGIQLAIPQRESILLAKPPAQDLNPQPGEPGKPGMRMNFPGANTQPTHLLTAGELFGSLRCLATQGHTPGHFSFLDERDGTLYTGDAMVTVGGKPHIPGFGPWFFPFPKFATWHRPTSVAVIAQLVQTPPAIEIRRIAPGHGPVLEGGSSLLEAALREAGETNATK